MHDALFPAGRVLGNLSTLSLLLCACRQFSKQHSVAQPNRCDSVLQACKLQGTFPFRMLGEPYRAIFRATGEHHNHCKVGAKMYNSQCK